MVNVDAEPRYRLLGPVRVAGEQGTLRTRGPKQRAVLAALLLNANHVVPEDLLFSLVWGTTSRRVCVVSSRYTSPDCASCSGRP